MDFQTLTRIELQSLCKKNNIPANLTNAAMAEALKALNPVESIGEITQPSQSGTSQFSAHSLETEKITSPASGRRSTRLMNITKPALDSVNPTTRTPAPMSQTNKKGQKAMACLNMNSQLNECADDDSKNSLVTPAPLGATGRKRRRVEESDPTRVYSTRRSVRLAHKSKAETSTETENEETQGFKKDTPDNNGVDKFEELPKITDSSELVSNGKEDPGIVSGSQDVYISEIETCTEELKPEEGESLQDEAVNFMGNVLESGVNFVADGNTGFRDWVMQKHSNNGPIMDESGSSKDVTELNMKLPELKLQQAGKEADSEFVIHSDILVQHNENEVNKVESLQLEELEKSDADLVHLDERCRDISEQNLKSGLEISENVATEVEVLHLEESEKLAKQVPSEEQYVDSSEKIPEYVLEELGNEPTETEDLHIEEREKSGKSVPGDEEHVDFSDPIPKSDIDVEELIDSKNSTGVASDDPIRLDEPYADFSKQNPKFGNEELENEPTEKEVLHLEESEKSAELVASDEHCADLSEQFPKSDIEVEGSENDSSETEVLHLEENEKSANEQYADLSEQIPEDSMAMKMSGLSENIGSVSEFVVVDDDDVKVSAPSGNIGSGSELVDGDDMKMSKKRDGDLNGMSMRKLMKMLKGNLEKTKTPSKNENGIEESKKSAMLVTPDKQYADCEGLIDTHDITNSDSTTMKMSGLSENIASVSELVVDDDDVKMSEKRGDGLHHMSMRKLAKMLKDNMGKTKKPSKNENGIEATARTAL